MEWPLVGRDPIVRRLGALLAQEHVNGIEIVGEAGVGKSRLALELVRAAATNGRTTEWLEASAAAADIPYGAFAQSLSLPGASVTEPALLATLQAELTSRAAPGSPLVLAVDDVHLLDERSAVLVHHVAVSRSAFVILTRRDGLPARDALRDLWKNDVLERVELGPLDRTATVTLVESVLRGPLEPLTAAALWRRSGGNPLYLRELVNGALETGSLVLGTGGWQMFSRPAPTPRLRDLVEARLGQIDAVDRETVELVAIAGSIDLAALERLTEPLRIERLEERRILAVRRSGNRRHVSLAHPLYGDVVAGALPETRARRLKRRLADELERAGARRRDDLLRLALWRLDGGGDVHPGLFVAASRHALAAFDGLLAERFARGALSSHPADVPALVLLGRAMASLHRVEEADAVFSRAADAARTEAEIADVALAFADFLYFRAGRVQEAATVLEAAAHRVHDPAARDEIDSLLVLFRAAAGDLPGVAQAGRALVERDDARPRAVVHGLMYASIANVMLGRFGEAEKQVEIGLRLAPRTQDELPLAGQMLRINRVMAAAYAGDQERALGLAAAGYRAALDSGAPEVASMWGMNHAECRMLAGRLEDGRRMMLAALAVARERDPFAVRAIDAGVASTICTWLGRHEEARELRDEIVDLELARDVRSRIWLDRANVWVRWAEDGTDTAARLALAAGDRAAADTHLVWAGWLFHDGVRLGRPDLVADRLAALTQSVGGELVPTMAAHARAHVDDDGAALDRAASAFERLGSLLYAAEASAHAHAAHLRRGEPQLARFAAARAGILAARCQGPTTPPLADVSATPLTPRELVVARLAASGLPSREIGERLRISVRTVDNHLGVIYDKLGASGRADLPTLFGTAALAPVLDESSEDGTARVRAY